MSNIEKLRFQFKVGLTASILAAIALILVTTPPVFALSYNVYLGRDIEGSEEELARYDLLVLSPRVLREPCSLRSIRELNPDIQLYMIFDLLSGNEGDVNFLAEAYSSDIPTEWKMRSTTGEVLSTWPETFLGNITEHCPEVNGRQYRDYAVKFLEKNVLPLMGEFDGLFLDECFESILWIDGSFSGGYDLNNDHVADEPDSVVAWVRRGWESMLDDIRERHADLPIIGNGNNHFYSRLNGRMFEDFPNPSFGNLLGGLAQMETWRMNQENPICLINATADYDNDTERRASWALCNFTGQYLGFDGGPWEHNHMQWSELFDYELGESESGFKVQGSKLLERHFEYSKVVEGLFSPVIGRWVGGDAAVWGDGSLELTNPVEGWQPLISMDLDPAAGGRDVLTTLRYRVLDAPEGGVKLYQAFRAHGGQDGDKVSLPTRIVAKGESGYVLAEGNKTLSNRGDYFFYLAASDECKIVVDEIRVFIKSSAYVRQDFDRGVLVHSLSDTPIQVQLEGDWHPDPGISFAGTWYEMDRGELMIKAGETMMLLPGALPADDPNGDADPEGFEEPAELPGRSEGFHLGSAYPNPFNPKVTLPFSLDHEVRVRASIFDVQGRRVKEIANEVFGPGQHQLEWQGRDEHGAGVSSGLYFLKMEGGGESSVQKLILAG